MLEFPDVKQSCLFFLPSRVDFSLQFSSFQLIVVTALGQSTVLQTVRVTVRGKIVFMCVNKPVFGLVCGRLPWCC